MESDREGATCASTGAQSSMSVHAVGKALERGRDLRSIRKAMNRPQDIGSTTHASPPAALKTRFGNQEKIAANLAVLESVLDRPPLAHRHQRQQLPDQPTHPCQLRCQKHHVFNAHG
eukprot:2278644-Rhodomonas_salina.1